MSVRKWVHVLFIHDSPVKPNAIDSRLRMRRILPRLGLDFFANDDAACDSTHVLGKILREAFERLQTLRFGK
jgi:hypothetical protein